MMNNTNSQYKWPFFVETLNRKFEFYASSNEERSLWLLGFNFAIKKSLKVTQEVKEFL